MSSSYVYRKPVRRSQYSSFRRNLIFFVALLLILVAIAVFIYTGLRGAKNPQPVSAVQNTEITDNKETFTSPYFKFQDSGKWVLDKTSSTPSEYIYLKYDRQQLTAELDIWVNRVPIPLYLASSRVLPVRFVNDNSFEITGVSDPCVNQFAQGEKHQYKEVTINDAGMLCDPDLPLYRVVVSQIGGNYQLNLKRADGTAIQFVIVYEDEDLSPDSGSIVNIADSFQAL